MPRVHSSAALIRTFTVIKILVLAGHRAFLCFFYLDYAYNNPVVHCFIKVLKESLYDNPGVLTDGIALCDNEESLENGAKTSSKYNYHTHIA